MDSRPRLKARIGARYNKPWTRGVPVTANDPFLWIDDRLPVRRGLDLGPRGSIVLNDERGEERRLPGLLNRVEEGVVQHQSRVAPREAGHALKVRQRAGIAVVAVNVEKVAELALPLGNRLLAAHAGFGSCAVACRAQGYVSAQLRVHWVESAA